LDLGAMRAHQTRMRLMEIAQRLRLEFSSVCLGVLWNYSLASPESGQREEATRIVREGIAFAAALGASNLLLPVKQPTSASPQRAREILIASLLSLLDAAKACGVVLALENVGESLLFTWENLAEVVDALGSTSCRVCYDVGNAFIHGLDPAHELKELKARVVQIHLKDIRRLGTSRTVVVPLGAGHLDWLTIWDAIRSGDYRGFLVVEVPAKKLEAKRVAGTSREFLLNLSRS